MNTKLSTFILHTDIDMKVQSLFSGHSIPNEDNIEEFLGQNALMEIK